MCVTNIPSDCAGVWTLVRFRSWPDLLCGEVTLSLQNTAALPVSLFQALCPTPSLLLLPLYVCMTTSTLLHLHSLLIWSWLCSLHMGLRPHWPLEAWHRNRGHQSCFHNNFSVHCSFPLQHQPIRGAAVISAPCRSPEQWTRKWGLRQV